MYRLHSFIFILLIIASPAHAWKGTEANGEQPIFFGTLTSQEGNVFTVTNIAIGRSASTKDKVMLYEMPRSLKESVDYTISKNPDEDLTTALLELSKIKKITVPHPNVLWKWYDPESKRATPVAQEYIEVVITWRSGSTIHYLLKLGQADTKRPRYYGLASSEWSRMNAEDHGFGYGEALPFHNIGLRRSEKQPDRRFLAGRQ